MSGRWGQRYPAVAQMLLGVEDCLTVLSFPQEHRSRLASTNHAENLMLQLKRRTAVVNVFPNLASCDRLIGAVLIEEHEKWAGAQRGLFNMAELAALQRAAASRQEVASA